MPLLTRWFVRTAMVYLVLALLVGVALMAQNVTELPPVVSALSPVYFHLFMVGWVAQLIFGIGYWLFPTYTKEKPRGSERLAKATYALLNLGLVMRAISEPINTVTPQALWGWLLALSAILQWLAGMAFVANSWPRIKGK
jgi:cbb3-type cytochrome oxidase subunit 1